MIRLNYLYDFIDHFTSICPFVVENDDIQIVSKYDTIEISAICISKSKSHTYKVEYHRLTNQIDVYDILKYENYDVHDNDGEDPRRKECDY